jgi:hypothetical protein
MFDLFNWDENRQRKEIKRVADLLFDGDWQKGSQIDKASSVQGGLSQIGVQT